MISNDERNKLLDISSSISASQKIEPYYHDEMIAIWKTDETRNWLIYEKERKFVNSWEGF